MLCVIGSHALARHVTELVPLDIDLVTSYEEMLTFAKYNYTNITESYPITKGKKWVMKGFGSMRRSNIMEVELAWDDSLAKELHDLIVADKKTVVVNGLHYASLDVLYMLKMSHRYLRNSPHFAKTMRHIHTLRELGAKIRKEHRDFYNRRVKATYWYKHPSLKKGTKDFFNGDGVNYLYFHDDIHESVKIMDKPAYTFYQADNAEVQCDMNKFFTCDEQIRLNGVYEEASVLGLERAIIPFGVPYHAAFKKALEKVCTSITSGRVREFSYDNYDKVLAMFNENTFDKFFDDVKNDKVRLHSSVV